MKLHNLVELMVKDPSVDSMMFNALSMHQHLDNIHRRQEEAVRYKTSNNKLAKHAAKLALLKFTGRVVD